MANALIRMPKTAKRGEVIEIKTLIQHPFISFFTTATETGVLFFRWTGDEGFKVEETVSITVA